MKKNKIIFALLLLFFPMYVFAGSFSLSKTSESVQTGASTSFEIRVTNAAGKFQVTTSNSGVASVSINSSEANGDKVWIEETAGGTTRVTVNVTAGSQGGTATITVKPLDVTQYDTGNELTGDKTFTLTVTAPHVASGNSNLSSLSISPGSLSPTFSASTTTYTATVDAGSITINASAADGAASVSGRGGKNLNYGENTFEVVCTAENGNKKTYVLKITRPDNRSSNSFLRSLSVDGMTLNPTFNKNTTSYSLPQVDASSITVNAAAEDSKATVSGAGKRNLDYGDNSIRIEVKAENDSTKVYTINVNRKDNRETVNTLSALSVEGYSISPKFSEGTTDYSLTVPSNVSEVTINATRKSNKSSFVKNYGPRKVNLSYGENKVLIQVQAENTSSKYRKSYTIRITRPDDRDTDNTLSSLSVDQGSFTFDKNTKEYIVNVNYGVEKINVSAVASSGKARVEGTGEHNLIVGENIINVTCIAENDSKSTYAIKVNRLPEDATPVEEIDFIKTITIDGIDLGFAKNKYKYNVEVKADVDKLDLKYDLYDGITAEILGNENLVDGSVVKIIARTSYGASMEYTIVVTKKTDWMSGTNSIYIGCGALIAFAIVFFGIKGLLNKSTAPAPEFGTTYIAPDTPVVDNTMAAGGYAQQETEQVNQNRFVDTGSNNNVPNIDSPKMDEFSNNNNNNMI